MTCLLSAQIYASSLSITLNAKNKIVLDTKDKISFVKKYSVLNGSLAIIGDLSGDILNISEEIPQKKDLLKNFELKLINNKSVQLIDKAEDINEKVNASFKKALNGKIKSVIISSSDYKDLYRDFYEQTGLSYLKQFDIDVDSGELNVSYNLSDFKCIRNKKDNGLECDQNISLRVVFSDDIIGIEKIKKELSASIGVLNSFNEVEPYLEYDNSQYKEILEEAKLSLAKARYAPEYKSIELDVKKIKSILSSKANQRKTIKGSLILKELEELRLKLKLIQKKLK
jgi:hypothetical protein